MEIKENVAYWCKTEELAKEFLEDAINFIGEENFKKYILEIKEELK